MLKGRFIGEEAFIRIAPAISGLADRATVHNLFKALATATDQKGISLEIWLAYIQELVKTEYTRDGSHTRLQTFRSCHRRDFYAWPPTGKDLF
jgi:hypothetical protein